MIYHLFFVEIAIYTHSCIWTSRWFICSEEGVKLYSFLMCILSYYLKKIENITLKKFFKRILKFNKNWHRIINVLYSNVIFVTIKTFRKVLYIFKMKFSLEKGLKNVTSKVKLYKQTYCFAPSCTNFFKQLRTRCYILHWFLSLLYVISHFLSFFFHLLRLRTTTFRIIAGFREFSIDFRE